jgi:hypothetical protein
MREDLAVGGTPAMISKKDPELGINARQLPEFCARHQLVR